jgi:hypothetical protein
MPATSPEFDLGRAPVAKFCVSETELLNADKKFKNRKILRK